MRKPSIYMPLPPDGLVIQWDQRNIVAGLGECNHTLMTQAMSYYDPDEGDAVNELILASFGLHPQGFDADGLLDARRDLAFKKTKPKGADEYEMKAEFVRTVEAARRMAVITVDGTPLGMFSLQLDRPVRFAYIEGIRIELPPVALVMGRPYFFVATSSIGMGAGGPAERAAPTRFANIAAAVAAAYGRYPVGVFIQSWRGGTVRATDYATMPFNNLDGRLQELRRQMESCMIEGCTSTDCIPCAGITFEIESE